MDTHIGDLHSTIVDREIEIIQGLLEQILIYGNDIGRACDVCAELDCLLSFAEASSMYDYRRPCMVEDNVIDIRQGRSGGSNTCQNLAQCSAGILSKNKSLMHSSPMTLTLSGGSAKNRLPIAMVIQEATVSCSAQAQMLVEK